MATPFESAQLILKLFELRRDPVLREARTWFVRQFHPETLDDVKAALASEHNPKIRMVVGYWDMAASLVTHGAIDRQMFLDANTEIFATFSKIYPLLSEIRGIAALPGFAKHLEEVVLSVPGMEERLAALRERFRSQPAPPAEPAVPQAQGVLAKRLTPILNVSDIQESFAWFEKLGWKKGWDWGDPPNFGGVCSGGCEIFLCHDAQGGRGRGDVPMTFGPEGDDNADKGVWMSIWVDDADAVHQHCLEQGLEVTWPPTDMPWNVREMHVRHPDGHVFRISQGLQEE
jgi:catechol 2,3-dioxygenase-like lactoylglutathione lyase family enzyme